MLRAISIVFVLVLAGINSGAGDPLSVYTVQFTLEADNLPDSKVPGVGTPDPYCKVLLQQFGLGGYKSWKQTELIYNTNNPQWSKVFEITWATDGVNKELRFEIHDSHRGEIAHYDVDVRELVRINQYYVSQEFTDTSYDVRNSVGTRVGKFHIKHRVASITTTRSSACRNYISLRNNLLILTTVTTLIFLLRN